MKKRAMIPIIIVALILVSLYVSTYTKIECHSQNVDKPTTEDTCEPVEVYDGYVNERSGDEFTRDEGILMAAVVYCEARGCDDLHQQLVAKVVLNRMRSDSFPDTIHDVVYQAGQYECVNNGQLDRALRMYNHPENLSEEQYQVLEMCLENAAYVLTEDIVLTKQDERTIDIHTYDNMVYQAEFKQGSGVAFHLGNTYFCYE